MSEKREWVRLYDRWEWVGLFMTDGNGWDSVGQMGIGGTLYNIWE